MRDRGNHHDGQPSARSTARCSPASASAGTASAPSAPEPERRKRFDGAETREDWLIRRGREREQAREEPEKYVFRASAVKAGSVRSRGYDHQDEEECAELALNLLRWGDVIALPQDVLERALRDNDPYRYEQPLDLDVYACRARKL